MSLVIGLLTFVLVVNCLFLMLLVLIQLPKKEAGAGLAFGGGATDALFGAGSGNALTKVTKYTATCFLGLALVLAVLNSRRHERSSAGISQALSRESAPAQVVTPPPAAETPQQQLTQPQPQSLTTQPQPLQLTPVPSNAVNSGFEPLVVEPTPPAGTTPPAESQAPANPAPAPQE